MFRVLHLVLIPSSHGGSPTGIGGLDVISGPQPDEQLFRAVSRHHAHVEIWTASYEIRPQMGSGKLA